MNVSFKPKASYVGDAIPYYEDGKYFIYYLDDPRSKEKGIYAEETTWGLLESEDGVEYSDKGRVLPLGNSNTPYLNNYTGSVIKGKDNLYYAFFTAFNAENEKYVVDGKAVQSVMVARGESKDHLEIIENSRFIGDNRIYEIYDWRDPYVFYNEEEDNYWMLLCSRVKGTGYHRGGCIALCKSKDLLTWTYEKPFYEPNMYITMECPEVFRMGSWWYLVFSTFSDRFMTHYRKSKSLEGPWIIPYEDTLDCRCDYAIKTAGDSQERLAFGWIPTKLGRNDGGPWEWGGTLIAHRLLHDEESGDLKVSIIPEEEKRFKKKIEKSFGYLVNSQYRNNELYSEGLGAALYRNESKTFLIKAKVKTEAQEFGLFLGTDETLENGYQLRVSRGIICLDKWPRFEKGEEGIYQWQIKGDVPFLAETIRYYVPGTTEFDLKIIRDEEVLIVYINDSMVMSTRIYRKDSGLDGIYVIGGKLEISSFEYSEQ